MTLFIGIRDQIKKGARDYWTIQAMLSLGGSFVKALGGAARRADATNLNKIKATWTAYWAQYEVEGHNLEELYEKGEYEPK